MRSREQKQRIDILRKTYTLLGDDQLEALDEAQQKLADSQKRRDEQAQRAKDDAARTNGGSSSSESGSSSSGSGGLGPTASSGGIHVEVHQHFNETTVYDASNGESIRKLGLAVKKKIDNLTRLGR